MLAIMMLLLPLLGLLALVRAENTSKGQFIMPPKTGAVHDYSENPQYRVGDHMEIKWESSAPVISLWLWQNDNPNAELLVSQVKNTGTLSWKINTNKDYSKKTDSNGEVFFIQLVAGGGVTGQIGSHYFNLTNSAVSSSSSSSTAGPSSTVLANNLVAAGTDTGGMTVTTTTTSSSSSPTSATSTTASASQTQSASSNPNNASSPKSPASSTPNAAPATSANAATDHPGLAAGLGVAFGLVFAGLIGSIIYIIMRRRKAKQLAERHEEMAHQAPLAGAGAGTNVYPAPGTIAPAPVYMGAVGYHAPSNEKQPPAEMMDGRQTYGYGKGDSGGGSGSSYVHEMPQGGVAPLERGVGSVKHISGVHEMPVQTRGHSQGIYSEEG